MSTLLVRPLTALSKRYEEKASRTGKLYTPYFDRFSFPALIGEESQCDTYFAANIELKCALLLVGCWV